MTEALIVQGGGRDHTPEEDVAGVRTVLRIQLSDEQRQRIGISADRDLALCVNRLCDALSAAEESLADLRREEKDQRDGLFRLRERFGAGMDETFCGFFERVAKERDEAERCIVALLKYEPAWRKDAWLSAPYQWALDIRKRHEARQ